MKKLYKLCCLYLMLLGMTSMAYAQTNELNGEPRSPEKIRINAGESKVIRVDFNVTKLGVGSPEIAEVILVSDDQVLINAISDGRTNLLLWSNETLMRDYEITVGQLKTIDDVVDELGILLGNVEGLNIRQAGDKILLEGEVYSRREVDRINLMIDGMPNVINLATTSKVYKKILAEEIQNTIGIDTVHVRYSRNGFVLEGSVDSTEKMEYAVNVAQSFSDSIINALYIKERDDGAKTLTRLVEIEVKVVDVNRDAFLNFANDFNVRGSVSGNASSIDRDFLTGNFTLSDNELRKLEEQGKGRVLLEHTLVAESSKTAQVFVGDEIPIVVTQEGGVQSVEYRKVGVDLAFTPVLYDLETVNMDVIVGSSTISGEGASGAPIVNNVNVSTSAYIDSGVSMVLSGLVRQRQLDSYFGSADRSFFKKQTRKKAGETGESKNNFLGGDQDPNRFTRERREVLVVVKPTIVNNASNTGRKMKKVIERSFKNQELSRHNKSNADYNTGTKRIILSNPDAE